MIRRVLIFPLVTMVVVAAFTLGGCSGSDETGEPEASDSSQEEAAPGGSPLAPAEAAQEAADEADRVIEERTGEIDD